MWSKLRLGRKPALMIIFAVLFAVPQGLLSENTHVVAPSELQQQMVNSTRDRQQNLDTVRNFLSTPTAEQAMKSAKMDPQKVQNAISSLSDEELAKLSQRASHAQQDFAAGSLSNRDLIWIILAIAALILIIVAVR